MKHFHFVEKISELPRAKAKTLVQTAYIAIVALFITIMVGIAITAWFLFTAPNKAVSLIVLVLLGSASFFGGRLHREVHEALIFLSSDR